MFKALLQMGLAKIFSSPQQEINCLKVLRQRKLKSGFVQCKIKFKKMLARIAIRHGRTMLVSIRFAHPGGAMKLPLISVSVLLYTLLAVIWLCYADAYLF